MLQFRYGLMSVLLVILASGCQQATGGADIMISTTPPGWGKPGVDYVVGSSHQIPRRYGILEWIKRGDNINNWNELMTTEDWNLKLVRQTVGTVGKYVAKQKRDREKHCPGRARWNVISENEKNIVYETWFEPCPTLADLYRSRGNPTLARIAEIHYYEISRIFDGTWNRWRLAYAAKGPGVSPEERTKWLVWLEGARIEAK